MSTPLVIPPPGIVLGVGEPDTMLSIAGAIVGTKYMDQSTGKLWIKVGPAPDDWRPFGKDTSRVVAIVEALRLAVHDMNSQAFDWSRNAAAGRWLEHEIAPLLTPALQDELSSAEGLAALVYEDARNAQESGVAKLTVCSRGRIQCGAQIISPRLNHAVRPTQIWIDPELARSFWVDSLKISNKEQLPDGGVPATAFARVPGRPAPPFRFDTIQVASDVVLGVTYRGDHPDGEEFVALILGNAADTSHTSYGKMRGTGDTGWRP